MLAAASFNQYIAADVALSHARLLRAMGRLPYRHVHRALLGLTWLETWLRWPLKTLNIQDSLHETFSLIDPDGRRFGLTDQVRAGFRKNMLYYQVPDLVVLLNGLDRRRFRKQALTVENKEVLLRARERGPGAIVVGFRIGAYSAMPWALASLGFPVSFIVGTEPLAKMGRALGKTFVPQFTKRIRFLSAQDPRVLAQSLEHLNGGGLVCTMLEMSPLEFEKTTEVRFLGWNVQVPYGISYLSAATRRSILPAVITREAGPRFRLSFEEPIPAPERDRASILENTQQLYRVLERKALEFPEQWVGWILLASHMGIDLEAPTSGRVLALF